MSFNTSRTIRKPMLSLIFTIIMILDPCAGTAEAFSLEAPTTTYEDFQLYNGIKVFIGGRYVEFNDEIGYPYIENGTVMISLDAIREGIGGHAEWDKLKDESYHTYEAVVVSKYDRGVQLRDNELTCVQYVQDENLGKVATIVTKEAVKLSTGIVKMDDVTYIPLRPLFEAFGFIVRWDNENQTVHIEIENPETAFPYIDFKDANVIDIQDLDTAAYRTLIYDGQIVDQERVRILKNSDQYHVLVADNIAQIFSYRFLSDLNYLYGKVKALKSTAAHESIMLYRPTDKEREFFNNIYSLIPSTSDTLLYIASSSSLSTKEPDKTKKSWFYNRVHISQENLDAIIAETHTIANEIKRKTSDPEEQAVLATTTLHNTIRYNNDSSRGQGAYTALVKKEAVCGGFSDALQFVLEELEIPVMRISGSRQKKDGTWEHHAWNQALINGKWYLFDATWGLSMKPVDYHEAHNKFERPSTETDIEPLVCLTYRFFSE